MVKKSFAAEVTFSRRPQNQKKKKNVEEKRLPQTNTCNLQNVTNLPMRAKTDIPPKQQRNIFPQHTEREWGR